MVQAFKQCPLPLTIYFEDTAKWNDKLLQEVRNRPNIDWQEQIHRGILRGLRNISETP